MSDDCTPATETDCGMVYQIRIKGHLSARWASWLEGLEMRLEDNGDTLLTGLVADQAALHGLLRRIRDLGLPLISVVGADTSLSDASDSGM